MAFGDLIGQERAEALITRALASEKVAHAYIFHGPDGVGKRLAALTLAMVLNCMAAGEKPCRACASCYKISRGVHPDVMLVEPAGANIRIEQIREIERQLSFAAYEGKRRLYILDPADALWVEAANAFLKTLEEPPADTVFVLLTDKLNALPPTIISRCQLVPFSPLRPEEAARVVASRTGLDAEVASLAVSFARGRLGAALSLDMEGFQCLRDELLDRWLRLSPEDGEGLLDFASYLTQTVREAERPNVQPLEILLNWFRDLAVLKAGAGEDALVHRDMVSLMEAEQKTYTFEQLSQIFNTLHETITILNTTNVNKELAITAMLVKMAIVKRECKNAEAA